MKSNRLSKNRLILGLISVLIVLLQVNQWLFAISHVEKHHEFEVGSKGTSDARSNNDPPALGTVGTPKKVLERRSRKEKLEEEKRRMQEPPRLVTGLPVRNNDSDNHQTMSACLLVMDDNHYLIEWLAYHYLILPLRYLIIAVDPRSKTSPTSILERWKDRMTIVEWSDEDFLPVDWVHHDRELNEEDSRQKFNLHRERQRNFYPTCLRALRNVHREWTTCIDSDEFLHMNPNYRLVKENSQYRHPPTIRDAIDKSYQDVELGTTSCITVPRLRFGNYENVSDESASITSTISNESETSELLQTIPKQQFLTLRWKYRSPFQSKHNNGMPKSMVDVSQIANYSRQETDAHRPVRSECPRRNLYMPNLVSPLVVNHYVGTYEQYTFRDDARAGMKQRDDERFAWYGTIQDGVDASIAPWLGRFVQEVGLQEARRLLEGVGDANFTLKASS